MEILARTPEGKFIFSKQYSERIKTYVHIARILVFQETIKQRFERAKTKFVRNNDTIFNEEYRGTSYDVLKDLVKGNNIDIENFAMVTFEQF